MTTRKRRAGVWAVRIIAGLLATADALALTVVGYLWWAFHQQEEVAQRDKERALAENRNHAQQVGQRLKQAAEDGNLTEKDVQRVLQRSNHALLKSRSNHANSVTLIMQTAEGYDAGWAPTTAYLCFRISITGIDTPSPSERVVELSECP